MLTQYTIKTSIHPKIPRERRKETMKIKHLIPNSTVDEEEKGVKWNDSLFLYWLDTRVVSWAWRKKGESKQASSHPCQYNFLDIPKESFYLTLDTVPREHLSFFPSSFVVFLLIFWLLSPSLRLSYNTDHSFSLMILVIWKSCQRHVATHISTHTNSLSSQLDFSRLQRNNVKNWTYCLYSLYTLSAYILAKQLHFPVPEISQWFDIVRFLFYYYIAIVSCAFCFMLCTFCLMCCLWFFCVS